MGLEVESIKPTGQNEMTVTVSSPSRPETTATAARDLAIRAATPYIGRCGFNAFDVWGYRVPPTAEHPQGRVLTEGEMRVPGALKAGGVYVQDVRVMGTV